jgi:hypothetical protein
MLPASCRSIAVRQARPGVAVTVRVVGVRADLESGRAARASLRSRAGRTGPASRVPRAQWVPRRPCA